MREKDISGLFDRGQGDGDTATPRRIKTLAFHMNFWKRSFFERYFPDRDFVFIPPNLDPASLAKAWMEHLAVAQDPEIFVWSLNVPPALIGFARERSIPLYFIEDGFLRSTQANASRSAPLSLAFDRHTAYFDSRSTSDLEILLNTYDFDADTDLLLRAQAGITRLLETGVSKYNGARDVDMDSIYGPKSRRRILVIGQVEDDASIRYGAATAVTNNDLVRLAAKENPDADIIYKPHPDILNRVRLAQSDPADVRHLCRILIEPMPLAKAFETIDHVYTITSLAGFEALMRRIPVTTFGCPFYAGWGLTDDRQPNARRTRTLTLEALFAASYLLYPLYFDPQTGARTTFEATVDHISSALGALQGEEKSSLGRGPKWRPWGPYGILGWRHLLTPVVGMAIARIGTRLDTQHYREDPIRFFRELDDVKFRRIGRILYPFDGT